METIKYFFSLLSYFPANAQLTYSLHCHHPTDRQIESIKCNAQNQKLNQHSHNQKQTKRHTHTKQTNTHSHLKILTHTHTHTLTKRHTFLPHKQTHKLKFFFPKLTYILHGHHPSSHQRESVKYFVKYSQKILKSQIK
jgi:hypothetical protein